MAGSRPSPSSSAFGTSPPEHPLISVFNLGSLGEPDWSGAQPVQFVLDFYSISLKTNFPAKVRYGQQEYDFDEGVMSFMAPGQVFGVEPPTR